MKIKNIILAQNGQLEHMEKKIQERIYYYQQEQVKNFVNKEYMIWPEMYGSGRLNIPLLILVLYAGAVVMAVSTIVQQPTVSATLRTVTATASALGFHFSKS